MDITADTLFQEVAKSFLQKVDKQKVDPRFVEKMLKDLFKSIVINTTSASTNKKETSSFSSELKKTYKELIKEQAFITEAKKFFSKIFTKDITNKLIPIEEEVVEKKPVEETVEPLDPKNIVQTENFEKLTETINKLTDKLKNLKDAVPSTIEQNEPKNTAFFSEQKDLPLTNKKSKQVKIDKPKDIKIIGINKLKDIKIIGLNSLLNSLEGVKKLKNAEDSVQTKKEKKDEPKKEKKENFIEKNTKWVKDLVATSKDYDEGKVDVIKSRDAQPVSIQNISPETWKSIEERLPKIIRKALDKTVTKKQESQGGNLGMLGAGLGLLLGGLAALVAGLMTDGPFKGLLKLLSRAGIAGAIKLLTLASKTFITGLKSVITAPIKLLKTAAKALTKIFGKTVYAGLLKIASGLTGLISKAISGLKELVSKAINRLKGLLSKAITGLLKAPIKLFNFLKGKLGKIFSNSAIAKFVSPLLNGLKGLMSKAISGLLKAPIKLFNFLKGSLAKIFSSSAITKTAGTTLKGASKIFGQMFARLIKFLAPILKRIPIIGLLISLGFAYTRFKSGDVVGGIIDILSGIASTVPVVGTAISIGLDVLNAFLDYKTGGASPETSKKKSQMLGDFFGSIWDRIKEKALAAFSWFTNIGKLIGEGKWGDAFMEIAGWIPGLDWVLGLFGTNTEQFVKSANNAETSYKSFFSNVKNWFAEKIQSAFSWLTNIGKLIGEGKWGDAFMEIAGWVPGLDWILGWLGTDTEQVAKASNNIGKKYTDIITGFIDWISTNILDKIFGFLGPIKDVLGGAVSAVNNIINKGQEIVTGAVDVVSSTVTGAVDTAKEVSSNVVNSVKDTASAASDLVTDTASSVWNAVTPFAEGGIVTQPTKALIGEAGPEAVIPLEKYYNTTNNIDNRELKVIAKNTEKTNNALSLLGEAIFTLARTFDNNRNTASVVVNGHQQQGREYTSVSQIANANVDAIRSIRQQFLAAIG